MDPAKWEDAQALLQQALDLGPAERKPFLDASCGDPEVRREVESLLAAHDASGGFLETPPPGVSGLLSGPPSEEPRPARFGPYRVLRRLGRGGMGEVLLAVRDDGEYRRRVAIKVAHLGVADAEDVLERFRQERQILAALDHDNIARLFDGGATESGLPYFVMEYVEGEPIDRYCERRGLSVASRLELFEAVCGAIQHAHQKLIVHRDLKPANILVTAAGVPKLLDFGIAKLLAPELSALELAQTRLGMRPVTPRYASPEQIRGEAVTTATDVYSLGVLLYELLVGAPPHELDGLPLPELSRIVCEVDPTRPSLRAAAVAPEPAKRRRRLEGDLDTIVMKALQKDPQRRYGSVDQLSSDVRRHLVGRPVLARPDTLGYRAGKFLRRHRLGVALAAAFALLVVGFGILMAIQNVRVARERDRALREAAKVRAVKVEGLKRVAELLFEKGDFEQAEAVWRETLALERRLLPENHPDVALTLGSLANLLRDGGRSREAEPLYRQALGILEGGFGERHELVAATRIDYGGCLLLLGRRGEAERLLLEVRADLGEAGDGSGALAGRAAKWLVRLYEQSGNAEAAARFRELAAVPGAGSVAESSGVEP